MGTLSWTGRLEDRDRVAAIDAADIGGEGATGLVPGATWPANRTGGTWEEASALVITPDIREE